jgi:hypothetical protein
MPTLDLSVDQVVTLFRQLPPETRHDALLALAENSATDRASAQRKAEARLRAQAAARGLDWDKLSEADRERLVDDWLHER